MDDHPTPGDLFTVNIPHVTLFLTCDKLTAVIVVMDSLKKVAKANELKQAYKGMYHYLSQFPSAILSWMGDCVHKMVNTELRVL